MQWPKLLNTSLAEVDPEITDIIEKEKNRQWKARRRSLFVHDSSVGEL